MQTIHQKKSQQIIKTLIIMSKKLTQIQTKLNIAFKYT